jgi:hypothetical protein
MLPYDDPRWKQLKGGYRDLYDPTSALIRLENGEPVEKIWQELWNELHHQGDVGEASYAAVPHLVRIQKEKGSLGWNFYLLVATIELERHEPRNPPMPDWLQNSYDTAWKDLLFLALQDVQQSNEPLTVRTALGAIALAKGFPFLGRLLAHHKESELEEIFNNV